MNFLKNYSCLLLTLLPLLTTAQVIFEDNFDGEQLNMNSWSYEEGDGCPNLCGWGNNERQVYNRDYVKVEDGNLVITASKKGDQYFSGKINSKEKVEFKYGIIEVRAKLATGEGLWPAVWMLGADISEVGWPASGEIDILEYVGREPHTVFTSLHTPASHGETINTKKTFISDIETGYHIYKTEWTEKYIKFFVDNELVYTFIPEVYDENYYPYNKDFYLLINMAVGGNFGGPKVDDAVFPAKFYIDYIKVSKL
ncbi:glycoside hydrolase family 16 protein [Gillisia sp. M10.2A]|uniref:Glycoside hydrolase family 16 protein n=1 Tax=Gillisia lutea TaxID=2909668 RepID=A0ABS9ED64_9FLAO|nr:glycoside hydrolase family 16 protein [Gillisia lutea]MCF4100802.1 glycoside hydrolase family 16 protein [Gillisia lutea]